MPDTPESYDKMTIPQLKELLGTKGVSSVSIKKNMKKADLIQMLKIMSNQEEDKDSEAQEDEEEAMDAEIDPNEEKELLGGSEGAEEAEEDKMEEEANNKEEETDEKETEKEAEMEEEKEDPEMVEKLRRRAIPFDLTKVKVDRFRDLRSRSVLVYPITPEDVGASWMQDVIGKAQQFFIRFFEMENAKAKEGNLELRLKDRDEAKTLQAEIKKTNEKMTVKLLDPSDTVDATLQLMKGTTSENRETYLAKRMLVVQDLPYYAKDEAIKEHFPEASYILRPTRDDGSNKGYCYVGYESVDKMKEIDQEILKKDVVIEKMKVLVKPVWQDDSDPNIEGLLDMSEKEEMRVRIQTLRGDRSNAVAEDNTARAYELGQVIQKIQRKLNRDSQIRKKMTEKDFKERDWNPKPYSERFQGPKRKLSSPAPASQSTFKRPRQTSTSSGGGYRGGSSTGASSFRGGRGGYGQGSSGYSQGRGGYSRGGGGYSQGGGGYSQGGGGYSQGGGGYSQGGGGYSQGGGGYSQGQPARGGYDQGAGYGREAESSGGDVTAVKTLLRGLQDILHKPEPKPRNLGHDYPARPLRPSGYADDDPYGNQSGYGAPRPRGGGYGGGAGGGGYGRY